MRAHEEATGYASAADAALEAQEPPELERRRERMELGELLERLDGLELRARRLGVNLDDALRLVRAMRGEEAP